MESMEIVYRQNESLLHGLARKFSYRINGDYEELLSVANMAFVRAYEKFDETLGVKFITMLHMYVVTDFKNFIWKNNIHENREVNYTTYGNEEFDDNESQEDIAIESWQERLSNDAKEVLSLLFEIPDDIKFLVADKPINKAKARNIVKDQLKEKGWNGLKIRKTFGEIKGVLQTC